MLWKKWELVARHTLFIKKFIESYIIMLVKNVNQ